jgi:carbonic anhydrase
MEYFTSDIIRGLLARSRETARLGDAGWVDVGAGPGSRAGEYIEWLTISDQAQSVVDDVTRIRTHPLVPPTITIYGYVFDVTTGRLVEVPAATEVGRAADEATHGARSR